MKIKCIKQFSFAKNTTYGLGGCAKICYLPKSIREAEVAYDYLLDNQIDFKVLGNGSNILASDDGFDGAVISLRNLCGIIKAGDKSLFCLAGTKISTLLEYCKRENLGGLEYLYGIPATVGGAAFMNAGVGNTAIGNDTLSVRLYDGKTHTLGNAACNFGYRYSAMRDKNAVITAVTVNV
ncbi:MAG: FAD-binding protein, partial [Clostridia bacterium]|nr:FAD-binding protein [Clostridia bacterium]